VLAAYAGDFEKSPACEIAQAEAAEAASGFCFRQAYGATGWAESSIAPARDETSSLLTTDLL
jgi:hypothetical protein